ncbi:MAG: amino acid ABC transporter ATP-binding protein [Cyanobacteriota bacterium]|nr:amino acid ABC transporter ATP-binding protein [Cyanobacteriota bacterium]
MVANKNREQDPPAQKPSPEPGLPWLRIEHLHKFYGSLAAVIDVNLQVNRGQQVVIVGASGSGKSTLLRCINYLETPSRGQIWLDGDPIGQHPIQTASGMVWQADTPNQLARKRRQIGMVFQGFNLFAHLNALDNIAIGPHRVLGRPQAQCREQARALLAKVHLDRHADHYPSQLSGGEQQRVAIARALAMDPKLILFDEPTSALDPRLTHEVLQVMQELAEEGLTMVVVTHEIHFARRFADWVVYMEQGQIVETGAAGDVLNRPQQAQTQRFLSYVMG